MTAQPLITIGMTCYNAAATIGAAVASAQAQTWPNTEIVIVDDCSIDNSIDILRALAAQDSRIRVVQNEQNGGTAASRNRVIAEAQGCFIAFFDDDDISLPTRLEQQYERITVYETDFAGGMPVICHTARTQRYPDGTTNVAMTMGTRDDSLAPHGIALAQFFLTGQPLRDAYGAVPTCSQMARTETYRKLGGFDPIFRRGEDTEFNIRLAAAGGHFVGISEPLVVQSMTLTSDKGLDRERDAALAYMDKHRILFPCTGSYEFCQGWVKAKFTLLNGSPFGFVGRLFKLLAGYPEYTLRRVVWALRGVGETLRLQRFHRGKMAL